MLPAMNKLALAATVLAGAGSAAAAASAAPANPCGKVADAWRAHKGTKGPRTVTAALAHECLNSVPVHKDGALKYIDQLVLYLEFQSDSAFKKNPPADYPYVGYDMFAEAQRVRDKVEADGYASEYEWQVDLYLSIFGAGHDGHFIGEMDLLSAPFSFSRPFALVSLSEDGIALPEIKVYDDVLETSAKEASSVVQINGQDTQQFTDDWIRSVSGNQDMDAGYNTLFYSRASAAENGGRGYFEANGRDAYLFHGPVTELTFANGTTVQRTNMATLAGAQYGYDWSSINSTQTFVDVFMPGIRYTHKPVPGSASTQHRKSSASESDMKRAAASAAVKATKSAPGYPKPVIMNDAYDVAGYFLDAPGFEDVAVLAMLTFEPSSSVAFQKVVQKFFARAVAAGKTKLVVDLQANGGGIIMQGYDTFRQIFPDIVQTGLTRFRESSIFDAMARSTSSLCADYDVYNRTRYDQKIDLTCNAVTNWRYELDQTAQPFDSYGEAFPKDEYNGDKYTALAEWDLNNPVDTDYYFGNDITGYGSRQNFTRPFAAPQDIVLLYDGYCASTCTIFCE